jgi:glycosyltransferase involved in cell wall biosynthesis
MTNPSSTRRRRLKLAVDVHGFSRMHQGTRTFIENIYREIPNVDPDVEIISFGEKRAPEFPVSLHVPVDLGSPAKRLTIGSWAALRKAAPHYVHYQYFCPIVPIGRSVITVHDTLPLTHPEYFNPTFRRQFRAMLGASVRLASVVTAVSDFTKESLASRYGLSRDSLVVVPAGVSPDLFTGISREEAKKHVRKLYGLTSYAISVSRIEKRKNIPLLIEAVTILNESGYPELRTVLVGSVDESAGGGCSVTREAIRNGAAVHLSGLSDVEKAIVLRAADVMAFPSLAEGFGIPPLEAMAAEVPVIVANRTAHGRIYANWALMIEGESVQELVDQMRRVLTDSRLRREIVERGQMFAHSMTWNASARALLDSIYRDAAGSSNLVVRNALSLASSGENWVTTAYEN